MPGLKTFLALDHQSLADQMARDLAPGGSREGQGNARNPFLKDIIIVDGKGEYHLNVTGKVGYRFFGEMILDCLNRTDKAMTQAHAFKAAELCLKAQAAARRLT